MPNSPLLYFRVMRGGRAVYGQRYTPGACEQMQVPPIEAATPEEAAHIAFERYGENASVDMNPCPPPPTFPNFSSTASCN